MHNSCYLRDPVCNIPGPGADRKKRQRHGSSRVADPRREHDHVKEKEMRTSQKGIDLIKKFEGCRLDAYKCPAGVWTIGYGHTAGVACGQKISPAQAEAYLRADLEKYEKKVEKYESRYHWTQNEIDAMVSFAYNLGSIDKLTANGTRTKAVIAEKILLYNKAGGKVLAGLTKRRQAERELFLSISKGNGAEAAGGTADKEKRPTIRLGSRGTNVTYLQQRLKAKGYNVGKIDGDFGRKTENAVKAYQKDNGLKVDGIVGARTWKSLEK